MFDKKYRVVSVESKKFNPMHERVRESFCCYPAYFKIGERGWFLFIEGCGYDYFSHKVHTTRVKDVIYTENRITVMTENTEYIFEVMEND